MPNNQWTKEEYEWACQEQSVASVKKFIMDCEKTGKEVTYDNFQSWIHEPYYEALQRKLVRENEEAEREQKEYERGQNLMAGGFRKVTFSFRNQESITHWILRSTGVVHPLDALKSKEKNYVILAQCDDDSENEVFEVIEEEDLPTYEVF